MSRKSVCGLLLIATIIAVFAGGLFYISGRGRLPIQGEQVTPSPLQAPLSR